MEKKQLDELEKLLNKAKEPAYLTNEEKSRLTNMIKNYNNLSVDEKAMLYASSLTATAAVLEKENERIQQLEQEVENGQRENELITAYLDEEKSKHRFTKKQLGEHIKYDILDLQTLWGYITRNKKIYNDLNSKSQVEHVATTKKELKLYNKEKALFDKQKEDLIKDYEGIKIGHEKTRTYTKILISHDSLEKVTAEDITKTCNKRIDLCDKRIEGLNEMEYVVVNKVDQKKKFWQLVAKIGAVAAISAIVVASAVAVANNINNNDVTYNSVSIESADDKQDLSDEMTISDGTAIVKEDEKFDYYKYLVYNMNLIENTNLDNLDEKLRNRVENIIEKFEIIQQQLSQIDPTDGVIHIGDKLKKDIKDSYSESTSIIHNIQYNLDLANSLGNTAVDPEAKITD